ncbi:MAG: TonB-dependent receptor [Gemmatimonadaceae bacterium]
MPHYVTRSIAPSQTAPGNICGALLRVASRVGFLLLWVLLPTPTATAQVTPRGTIRGRAIIPDGAPARGATIELRRSTDTVLVTRVSTAANGRFVLPNLAFGTYRVTVRLLGYTPRTRPALVNAAAPMADLGEIELNPAAVELQAIKVSEQRQRVLELSPDRNTFRVADLPTTRGGSAIDVLRNIPSVDVDIDNQVALRGNADVIVQINGRRSPMKPAQLGNYLAQLPAAMVERVEVVTNPSARDNAEGAAGIINVVLKSRSAPGSSGGLTLAQGSTRRAEAGANYGWQGEHLTVFGSYGYLHDRRPRTEGLTRTNLASTPITLLDQTGRRTQTPDSHTGTLALRFNPSARDEFAFDGAWSQRRERTDGVVMYRTSANGLPLAGSDRVSDERGEETNREATLEYKHAFAEDHEISTELRWVGAKEGGPTLFSTQSLTATGSPQGTAAQEATTAWEHPTERSLRVDYQRPLGEDIQWQLGVRGSSQPLRTTLDTRIADAGGAAVIPDLSRSNDFTFTQGVQAAYTLLTAQQGAFKLQGGLRVELTDARFRRATNGAAFSRAYRNHFPSALISWTVREGQLLKASLSSRIRRPDDPDQLDPTVRFQDPLNLSRGNPDLRPELIASYELGYQRTTQHTSLQVTPFWRHTQDAIRRLRTIDAQGVTTATFANIATVDAWGTDVTLALRGGRLTGFVGGTVNGQQSNAANVAPTLSTSATVWSARANLNVKLSSTLDGQVLVTYRAASRIEQGRNFSQTRVNAALRQKLRGDRLSLTLRVTDPFATEWERSITDDPRFFQTSLRRRQVRGVLLNLTWNFGKPPKGMGQADLLPDERG